MAGCANISRLLGLLSWTQVLYVGWKDEKRAADVIKRSSLHQVRVSTVGDVESAPFIVTEWHTWEEAIPKALKGDRPPFTVVVAVERRQQLQRLYQNVANVTVGFFAVVADEESEDGSILSAFRVVSPGHGRQPAVQTLSEEDRYPVWDLNDTMVFCSALTWEPWLDVERHCLKGDPNKCQPKGVLTDVMSAMGGMYNFSWEVHKEPNDNWGATPNVKGGFGNATVRGEDFTGDQETFTQSSNGLPRRLRQRGDGVVRCRPRPVVHHS